MLTGKGEQGLISIVIDEDPSGAAGSNAGIKATLTAKGTPTEYTLLFQRVPLTGAPAAPLLKYQWGRCCCRAGMEENTGADMPEPPATVDREEKRK